MMLELNPRVAVTLPRQHVDLFSKHHNAFVVPTSDIHLFCVLWRIQTASVQSGFQGCSSQYRLVVVETLSI